MQIRQRLRYRGHYGHYLAHGKFSPDRYQPEQRIPGGVIHQYPGTLIRRHQPMNPDEMLMPQPPENGQLPSSLVETSWSVYAHHLQCAVLLRFLMPDQPDAGATANTQQSFRTELLHDRRRVRSRDRGSPMPGLVTGICRCCVHTQVSRPDKHAGRLSTAIGAQPAPNFRMPREILSPPGPQRICQIDTPGLG